MNRTRLAVVCDFPEEGWPSMDLVGEMMLSHLAARHQQDWTASRVCPSYKHRLGRLPFLGGSGLARNGDRVLNRFRDYPRALKGLVKRAEFDLFHLVDHSYAQLVHALPPGRTVVTCHDLDTFRCLIDPERDPRPSWFRALARRTLEGLKRASAVVCNSETTRNELLAHGLVDSSRAHVAYLGIHPECSPEPDPVADAELARLVGPVPPDGAIELVHVGSTIPRKRIDILLSTFSAVRRHHPGARLLRAGGALNAEQAQQARDLGVAAAIVTLPFCSRAVLAALYRRASVVLVTSEAEGFGLPVIEALACGAPLIASDLPALREVGGEAPLYLPVADLQAWSASTLEALDQASGSSAKQARREFGIARAELFRWSRHADELVKIYQAVLGEGN